LQYAFLVFCIKFADVISVQKNRQKDKILLPVFHFKNLLFSKKLTVAYFALFCYTKYNIRIKKGGMGMRRISDSFFDMNNPHTGIIFALCAIICFSVLLPLCLFGIKEDTDLTISQSGSEEYIAIESVNNTLSDVTEHIIDPSAETRGVWIATVNNINFPSKPGLSANELKAEIDGIISTCKEYGLNAIYFQVRPLADAFYESDIFPVSKYLTGEQGKNSGSNFDVLDYLVREGHKNGVKVHAWVNPLRVTYGTQSAPAHDLTKLADGHPARENSEFTVPYADGKLYFNAGIPEVRELVRDGVYEIAKKYDVDSIVFDDYFYPYTVYVNGKKAAFDDSDAFEKYSTGESLEEFRRSSINTLVRECYEAVKAADPEMQFGISPFGIWQNDNGENGGSETSGLEAYNELYCDALSWIEGGYVDYIAPQIYWSFNNNAARYDTLVRWWNSVCDNTGVDLLISHAAYRYADEWAESDFEMLNQIEFARSEISYKGSIFYGYGEIAKNKSGIADELLTAFSDDYIYTDPVSTGAGICINSPQDGSTLSGLEQTYVLGSSDPAYPVYYNGRKISRTKSGYFSLMLDLKKGKNEFIFTQNGKDYIYTVYNTANQNNTSPSQIQQNSVKVMDNYEVLPVLPRSDIFATSGEAVTVTVTAPANSEVTAYLGDNTVKLMPQKKSPGKDKLYEMTYSGTLVLPECESGEIKELGNIRVKAVLGDSVAYAELADVRVGGKDAVIPIEVSAERTGLKISPDSYYYDDFTSQAKGMRDNATRLEGGFYRLRVGGYVAESDVTELDSEVKIASVESATIKDDGEYTRIYISADENIPMNGRVEDGYFILNLYNVDITTAKAPMFSENPLFESDEYQLSTKKNCFRYHFKLKDPDNFFGFEFSYSDGKTIVSLRNPVTLKAGDKPLSDRLIVLDAGHGGSDAGALGANAKHPESSLNLNIILLLRDKLEKLGAKVILTREDDSYVALADRMNHAESISPDILISVHQNSMEYNVDTTRVRGVMALYWEYAGKSLSESMSESLSHALGRINRGASTQRLAMVRCERYPSTLIEVGFMTSVEEYEKTSSAQGIEKTAQAIVDGVLDYYKKQSVRK